MSKIKKISNYFAFVNIILLNDDEGENLPKRPPENLPELLVLHRYYKFNTPFPVIYKRIETEANPGIFIPETSIRLFLPKFTKTRRNFFFTISSPIAFSLPVVIGLNAITQTHHLFSPIKKIIANSKDFDKLIKEIEQLTGERVEIDFNCLFKHSSYELEDKIYNLMIENFECNYSYYDTDELYSFLEEASGEIISAIEFYPFEKIIINFDKIKETGKTAWFLCEVEGVEIFYLIITAMKNETLEQIKRDKYGYVTECITPLYEKYCPKCECLYLVPLDEIYCPECGSELILKPE